MLPTFQKLTFSLRVRTTKLTGHQYRENGARNIYSAIIRLKPIVNVIQMNKKTISHGHFTEQSVKRFPKNSGCPSVQILPGYSSLSLSVHTDKRFSSIV